jgi:hypothetical protein
MPKKPLVVGLVVAVVVLIGLFVATRRPTSTGPAPTPTDELVQQLDPDKHPQVSLVFRPDGRYVTVNIKNLHAAVLEYNLIYNATVKNNKLQTGVNAQAKLDGVSTYSKEQLLGSESSGKFTYHANITNAIMELTLRDSSGRSIFTATYPFEVRAGQTVDLQPAS